jgi:hypothetical protein
MWYIGMMGLRKQGGNSMDALGGGYQTEQSTSHQIEHDSISFKNV